MPPWVQSVLDALGAAALSPSCAVCARILDAPTGGAVCARCWSAVRFLVPPLCPRCGYPVSRAADLQRFSEHPPYSQRPALQPLSEVPPLSCAAGRQPCPTPPPTCLGCAELRIVDRARALGPYEGALRDILHALKYAGRRSAAPVLAALLRARCGDVLEGADAVVPVPLHPRREWSRGFNQAALVARHLTVPVRPLLVRRRHTAVQAGLAADERRANVERAFGPSPRVLLRRSLVRGRCLVLVDDVSTTGATLDACAAVLKEHGAREVRALVVARTLKGSAVAL